MTATGAARVFAMTALGRGLASDGSGDAVTREEPLSFVIARSEATRQSRKAARLFIGLKKTSLTAISALAFQAKDLPPMQVRFLFSGP
ncbi:MAG: hypothetical protein ACXW27_17790 [Allosphingosinicella sp.]